jgi:enamine deaminase RidA (YjgF/YER057c/UK114 family)
MSSRTNYPSGAKWEDIVGYSRAVRVGNVVEVTGTVAVDEHNTVIGESDPYLQTKFILQKIESILIKAGASLKDVVRTRMFVTDISRWEEYGRAHGEVFADIRPCTTMVEVSKLIGPEYLIEIEATAIIH